MISTHVLDTSRGIPAASVGVLLEKLSGETWVHVANEKTNVDGRIAFHCAAEAATYRLTFNVETYFTALGLNAFFTSVPVIFRIVDTARKYHVPLLLNPFGYSTYRGS